MNKIDIRFLFFLVLIHSMFLTYQLKHKNIYLKDSSDYLQEANNIKNYGSFYCGDIKKTIESENFTKRPPLYPLFILFIKLFFNDLAIIIFQSLLSIFIIFYTRHIIKKLGYCTKWDWLFILFLILSPNQFFYTNFVMSEILLQAFIVLMFAQFVYFICYQKVKHIWLYTIFVLGAIYTKPVFFIFIIPNLFLLGYMAFKYKRKIIFYISLIPIFVVLISSYANYTKTSYFHFSSMGNFNFFYYNTALFLIHQDGEEKASLYIDSIHNKAIAIKPLKERSIFLNNASAHALKNRWLSYSLFHAKSIFYFFLDPGRFDFYTFFNNTADTNKGLLFYINNYGLIKGLTFMYKNQNIIWSFLLLIIFLFNLMKLSIILLFLFDLKPNFYVKTFLLVTIFYLAIVTGPTSTSRYSMPLNPLYYSILLIFLSRFGEIKQYFFRLSKSIIRFNKIIVFPNRLQSQKR